MELREQEQLSIYNICQGAVDEVFQRELGAVMENIFDVNTNPETNRKIMLEFVFTPGKDRSFAQVTFTCKSKTAGVEPVAGTVFLQRRGEKIYAVAHDPRQVRMFEQPAAEAAPDGKSAATGDKRTN